MAKEEKKDKSKEVKQTSTEDISTGFIGSAIDFTCLFSLLSFALVWLYFVAADAVGSYNLRYLIREVTIAIGPSASVNLADIGFIDKLRSYCLKVGCVATSTIKEIDVGRPLLIFLLACVLAALLSFMVKLFTKLIFKGKVERRMRSIDELARQAQEAAMADSAKADMERRNNALRLTELSDEITNIAPGAADYEISVEDEGLSEITSAVNNLVKRMNDSYRQQARFVSDASHELRTPIAVIKGYADMLERWGSQDENALKEGIEAIQSETDSMNRLVEQLLFLARSDSGRIQPNFETVSLTDLARELYSECSMIDEAHEYEVSAHSEVRCRADRSLIKQAARQLCENAAKYTPEGGEIIISAGSNDDGEPYFSVEDRGVGISPENVQSIFDRFYRADAERNGAIKGSGLGLAIVKQIVDSHGGRIDVKSVEGVGTRITMVLKDEKA